MSASFLRRPVNWIIAVGLCSSLTGCIGLPTKDDSNASTVDTDKVPNWVISPPQDNNHLYGVGSAPRLEDLAQAFNQAEQNGNVQIAQQLRTQVSQVNTQNTQVSSSGQGDEQVSKIQTAYTQVTTAPIELEQAINEQRYVGKNYVYALQSIDRSRIVSKLKAAISDLDESIRKQAKTLTSTENQAPASQDWQTYMQLIPRFAQRKTYQQELSLYSTQRTLAGRAEPDIQAIEQQLNHALSSYGFDVSQTDHSHSLASALSQYGLTPKANSIFQLKSNTSQHSETQNERFYVFEEGTLELIDPTGARLAAWTVSARGIAKNKASAEAKAADNWSTQAVQAMFTWLTRLN